MEAARPDLPLRSKMPVSEIENLFLMPSVIEAIAIAEGYQGINLQAKLAPIFEELFAQAAASQNQVPIVVRYCRRRIDRTLKKINLSAATDVVTLAVDYAKKTSALDVAALAKMATDSIQTAIADKDVPRLLKWYDNKGILSIACKAKGTSKAQFEQWIVRALRNNTAPSVSDAVRRILPAVVAV